MAMIVDALASQFAETLATLAKEEVTIILDAKDELRRLEKTVQTIRTVLQDAEHRAFTNPTVRSWLADLKDVVYDADDVIDYSRTKAENLTMHSSGQSVRCYSPLFSCFSRIALRHRIGSSIRDINERLERIKKDQSNFNLIVVAAAAATAGSDHHSSSSRVHRQTDPVLEPDIVGMGIENDTTYLVGLITAELGGPKIPVLAIVGMGGIGKTTLAQKIYNHKTIRDNFQMPPPIWVCVSQDYNTTNMLKEVIKCAGGDPEGAQSFAELQVLLTRVIEGRKFFLVLDDVWSAQVWENLLRKPLQSGASGSRVLITTRDERVAKQMGAVHLHIVQPLSIEDGWSLLCKMVFQRNESGSELIGDIGMQIVEKCGGLPLAIKTIAGVLRTKDTTRWEWTKVLQNPAWSLTDLPEGVMGVLYLSYEDLPFHLKQCFIFCSLFPEDHVFMRHKLIQHWVAEGFIKEEGDLIMEEVARGYYKDLRRRSLLQPDPRYYDDGGCKMHDLLRSLAQFLAQDENFVGDVKGLVNATSSSSMKLRHLSIVDTELNEVPEVVKEQKSLRTLLLMGIPLMEGVPQDLFEKLGCLRLLDFSWTDVMRLPEFVGNLVHLRYLDLSGSSIAELPETVGKLSNLQYLILQNCENLEKLPKSIAKLYKLRSLDLLNTPVNGLPVGIGRLQQLNRLMGFVTNESINGGWCSLEELKSLSRLRSLTIGNLERALIRTKPRGFLLKDKHHIRHLELYCTPCRADGQQYGDEEAQKIQEIFEEELFPPPSLEKFEIKGFFGLQFPNWMMTSNAVLLLFNLRRLDLLKCGLCKQLPPLGQLPNLDLLKIRGANSVKSIGAEFMGVDGSLYTPFPKLETLQFKDMLNLVDWRWEVEEGGVIAMPRLETLNLINCPSLRSLPGGLRHVMTLATLFVQGANSLAAIENLVSIKVLVVLGNPNLARVSNLPSLQTMAIDGCLVLREVEGLHSLQSLTLQDLAMESLPEWLLLEGGEGPAFPMLQRLHVIVGGVHVLRRCIMGGPDWPKIQHFANVYIQVIFGSEFVFYSRDPFTFNTNLDPSGGDSNAGAAPNH